MAKIYLIITLLILIACKAEKKKVVEMTSFNVIDERDFVMCFNQSVEGYFALVIKTKSGKHIKKEGILVVPQKRGNEVCFKEQKMQFSFRAYDENQKIFYRDSIVNENLGLVEWKIYKDNLGEKIVAEGKYNMTNN